MAARAVAPELPVVNVFLTVAIDALAGQRRALPHGAGMAGSTLQAGMSTFEAEVGLYVVIEDPDAPVVGCMAGSAFFAQALLMHVVRLVAGDARRLHALEPPVDMA